MSTSCEISPFPNAYLSSPHFSIWSSLYWQYVLDLFPPCRTACYASRFFEYIRCLISLPIF